MKILIKGIFWFATAAIGVRPIYLILNEIDDYINTCPMCNEKTRAMFISEDKSQRLDAIYIQKIMTKSDNW